MEDECSSEELIKIYEEILDKKDSFSRMLMAENDKEFRKILDLEEKLWYRTFIIGILFVLLCIVFTMLFANTYVFEKRFERYESMGLSESIEKQEPASISKKIADFLNNRKTWEESQMCEQKETK